MKTRLDDYLDSDVAYFSPEVAQTSQVSETCEVSKQPNESLA
jgi:hypothetical protein